MLSWLILLPGIGMIAVGATAIWLWHGRAALEYFAYGAVFWAVAIAIKVVMNLILPVPVDDLAFMDASAVLAIGLYYGLRTGVLENGIPYLACRLSRMRFGFSEAVAVGLGFGATEAILLGLQLAANSLAFLTVPGLFESLPGGLQVGYGQLAFPQYMALPVIERLFTIPCHLFTVLLTLYSVKTGKLRWLGVAVLLKTFIDGEVFPLDWLLAPVTYWDKVLILVTLGLTGLVSTIGILLLRKRWQNLAPEA